MKRSLILTALSFLVLAQLGLAQVPRTFSYQGVLRDGGGYIVANGTYYVTFSIYDAVEETIPAWTSGSKGVSVTDGVFSVILGQDTPLPESFPSPAWLGIKVKPDTDEMPRIELTAVPFALQAGELNMPPTERWYSIPGIEFNADSGSNYIGSYVYKDNAGNLFAPVHLPHGATVTGFEAYFYDVDDVNANIDLYRYYDITGEVMASATTTSISAYGTVSDNTIIYAHIDNQFFTYLVMASWNTPTQPLNIRIYNVRIKYTVDRPLP